MSIYSILGPDPGAEVDTVTEAEISKQQELQKVFGLPEMSPAEAAEAVRAHRARVEQFKSEHPGRWAAAERDAEISRGYSELRRKLEKEKG